ncbi:MAG: translation initiation factor IF-2 N-terminal domain-containing protein, partial [Blastocatellia bacterium]
MQKIRIYDLAKELKLDNKRVLDDARREGIDVSVPSNTIPTEVAERIRTKYYPKKAIPTIGPRLVKTVKQAPGEQSFAEASQDGTAAVEARELETPEPEIEEYEQEYPSKPEPPKPKVIKLKAAPPPPEPVVVVPPPPPIEEPEVSPRVEEPAAAAPRPQAPARPAAPPPFEQRPRSQV